MTRISAPQRTAVLPNAAPAVPVMSALVSGRMWLGEHTDPCTGNYGTHGFPAKRSTRQLGRSST